MQNIIDRILNKLKIEDYIDIEIHTRYCNYYDPIGLRTHITNVVKHELMEEK